MPFVDRIVHRFIHRAKRGDADRPRDEIGRNGAHAHGPGGHGSDGHGRSGHEHAGHEQAQHGHHENDLHEPGRFSGEHAERYDRRSRSKARFYRRTARDVVAVTPADGHVLDVGTGPGRLLVEVARARPDVRVTGVDVEPDMVRLAERAARDEGFASRVRAEVADVAALPLEAASVDVVVATLAAHHWPEVDAAVRELARVLRPGGVLLVVDFRSVVEGPLSEAVAAAMPGATTRRRARWAWGLPALSTWEVRPPAIP